MIYGQKVRRNPMGTVSAKEIARGFEI